MGPGRDLEENASARIRNIETFEVGFILLTIIIAIMAIIDVKMMILIEMIIDRKLFENSWRATTICATRTSSPSTPTTMKMRLRFYHHCD